MLLAKVASPIVPDTVNKKLSKAPSPEGRWSKGCTDAIGKPALAADYREFGTWAKKHLFVQVCR
jgi:hypothetical protein